MSRRRTKQSDKRKPRTGGTSVEKVPKARHSAGRARRSVCVALVLAVLVVFGRSVWFGFVDYDDPANVTENPFVRNGLTLDGLLRAFSHSLVSSWVPLTAISHMLDCQVFGLWAGGHHLTNVLLHAATSVLLFLVLRDMTGSLWRSAFVAALFALHPLRAESVVWISERKDVLSGFFFMLTLGAYVRWTRHPSGSRLWVCVFLALGLLSKAMLITTPLVLLLLDHWPLRRTAQIPFKRLLIEKIPLFLLSVAAVVAQLLAAGEAIASVENHSIAARAANAVVSCAAYVAQMAWPSNLAAVYPYPRDGVSTFALVAAIALLVAVSAAAFLWRRRFPWIATGWLWYLVMLAPVLGLIQVGDAARADRYTYLPQIGLCLIVAWTAGTWCAGHPRRRVLAGTVAVLMLTAMSAMSFRQTAFWKDTETLWNRALACTSDNDTAHYNLGTSRLQQGKLDEAIAHFEKTLEANPGHANAHINLGQVFLKKNMPDRAILHYRKAIEIRPHVAQARFNLGVALEQTGKTDEAVPEYEAALRLEPGNARAHFNLATILTQKGRHAEALAHCEKVLESDPKHANAGVLAAWLLATSPGADIRNGTRAVELARGAIQLTGETNPVALRTLAAACAEADLFEDAMQSARRALDLAVLHGREELAGDLRRELELYKTRQPVREGTKTQRDH